MKSILSRTLVFAAFVSTGLLVHAQDSTPIAPIEYLRPMKNSFSVGVRMIGGANVTFSGALGVTPYQVSRANIDMIDSSTQKIVQRVYDNGIVNQDSAAPDGIRPEYDNTIYFTKTDFNNGQGVDGRFYSVLTDANGKPVIDSNGNYTITGDYLMYNDAYTRNWSYTGTPNLRDAPDGQGQQIGLSSYSSAAAANNEVHAKNSHAPGIEFTLGRVIQRFKHFEWGVSIGFGISEFNAKTRQSTAVELDYITDWYNVYNTGPNFDGTPTRGDFIPSGTSGTSGQTYPSFATTGTAGNPGDFTYPTGEVDAEGNPIYAAGTRETTNPISKNPDASDTSLGDPSKRLDSTVDGYWQVKGVYYLMRIGPMVRIPIGKRFSAYLSGGYMAAYVGSKFRYEENVNLPNGAGSINIKMVDPVTSATVDYKANQQYLGGYYFDANFEWWISTRTGFYAGVAYENLGQYEQQFAGRKATVKMDNGLGWRFGIMTRF